MGITTSTKIPRFLLSESNVKVTVLIALPLLLFFKLFSVYMNRKEKAPPRKWPVVGMLPSLFLHINELHDWLTQLLKHCGGVGGGGTFYFKGLSMSNMETLITADPAVVEHVLNNRFGNYPKGRYLRNLGHDFLGDGILNADGDAWKVQRRTGSAEFSGAFPRARMGKSAEELVRNRLVPFLQRTAGSGEEIDLQDVLLRFAFDNVCMITLGIDPRCFPCGGPETREFARAFQDATEVTMLRFVTPPLLWKFMRFFQLGPERKLRRSVAAINGYLDRAIGSRTGSETDLLAAFAKLETGNGEPVYTNKKLREIAVSFILAGRESSSVVLSWFFWLLLCNPRVEERIHAEIRSVSLNERSGNGNWDLSFTVEEVKHEMHYLQAALSESLRLFPAVPFDYKVARSDDRLPDGRCLRKGVGVIYSIYAMGRMEGIWGKDCMEFRPERWLDTGGKFVSESVYKYPVFNAGPRLCLGKDFAYYQMKLIAATILCGFKMKMVKGHVVKPKLALTLYMKHGLLVTLHPRDGQRLSTP